MNVSAFFVFIIAAHFALLNGCPGNLVISARRIRFAPTRGFQKLGLKKLANRIAAHNGDEPPGTAASALQPDLDLDLPTGEIVGVRKDKRLGFEGLTITARDGQVSAPPHAAGTTLHCHTAEDGGGCISGVPAWQVFKLANMSRRDEAATKILSCSPASWSQT